MVVAAATTAVFLLAGWHGGKPLAAGRTGQDHGQGPGEAFPETVRLPAQPFGDVGEAIRIALKRLAPVIASQSVLVDVAAGPGLLVRMRGPALADLLEELLALAIHSAPVSRLLLTASARGERIYVTFSDDVPNADLAVRQSQVRGLAERVALRGGVLDINVRACEGTTVTLRLAAAVTRPVEPVPGPERAVPVRDMVSGSHAGP